MEHINSNNILSPNVTLHLCDLYMMRVSTCRFPNTMSLSSLSLRPTIEGQTHPVRYAVFRGELDRRQYVKDRYAVRISLVISYADFKRSTQAQNEALPSAQEGRGFHPHYFPSLKHPYVNTNCSMK